MARFVIADDSIAQRMWLGSALLEAGHEIVGYGVNGKEAVDLCRKHRPDFVTLDLNMPEMTGNEAARIITDEKLAGHVIVLSLNAQSQIMDPLTAMGCLVLKKPLHEKARFIKFIEPLLK